MATHKIVIDPLDSASIEAAIRELDRIEKEFDQKMEQFLQEIAEIGRQAAAGAYGPAVDVTVSGSGDELIINANGRAVVFLEFGAGDATDSWNRYASEMPFLVYPGSWSEEDKQQYSKNGYWFFAGQMMTEVRPRRGMLKAYETIREKVGETAKRVFG